MKNPFAKPGMALLFFSSITFAGTSDEVRSWFSAPSPARRCMSIR